ncbi:Flp pilus assembly protein CpaB [Fusibacter sp. 3D3]|uniref:Flp pilus assembly protein CpaB n=1 Tax=Fusibacter sp. 3D3 TaxID=1048380 RepID=UPI0008534552|nr:Flp pilus assembly protein CpaB [Fusibacter sp. 3D3]GAU76345.1 Flp pilus assembly protein RcpC/CpaB [Fusibacter sp. 3D3]
MLKKVKLKIVIAIIFAIIAGFSTFQFLGTLESEVPIVVAAHDIEAYTLLESADLKVVKIDKDEKQRFFPYAASQISELRGSIVRNAFSKEQPIQRTPDNLLMNDEKAIALNYDGKVDDAYFIPYDKRIISIEVDSTGAVAEQLKPGDFVDIIFTSSDESTGGLYSNLMLQHIQIFKIISPSSENAAQLNGNKKQYVLMATPEECLYLAVAKRNGVIDLILNPLEGDTDPLAAIHVYQLSAEPPMTDVDEIEGLISSISNDEVLSKDIKSGLIKSLEGEIDLAKAKVIIESSNIPNNVKLSIYELIDAQTPQSSSLDAFSNVENAINSSVLSDTEKDNLFRLLGNSDSIQEAQRKEDVKKILQEVNSSNLDENTKSKIRETLAVNEEGAN